MDSLLVLGSQDELLSKFLTKMGYQLLNPAADTPIPEILSRHMVDLMLLDTRTGIDAGAMLDVVRADEATRCLPVVCLTDRPRIRYDLKERQDDKLEIIEVPYKIGSVVSRIATRLRLRKIAGADSENASLAEVNAMLRDLTQRFQQQLDEARSIQQGLLPEELPKDDRFELAVLYQPLEEVGGDWYFVNKSKSGGIGMQVADVTGHGLAAAFVGSMTKLALTAADREPPGELLTEMNRLMSPQIPNGRFVTMISLRYDPATGELATARAGNPPAIICRSKESKVEEVAPAGFAVGFFEDSDYSEVVHTLEPGDVVAIFTDGITEAQNRSGEMFGTQRIGTTLLEKIGASSLIDMTTHLVETFEQFCEERIVKDDITLLLLRRKK